MIRKNMINRTIEVLFTLFGMWPDALCIPFCRIFWIITIIIVQFYHYRYLRTHFYSADLFSLMDWLSSFIAYAKVFIRFIVFWLNQS